MSKTSRRCRLATRMTARNAMCRSWLVPSIQWTAWVAVDNILPSVGRDLGTTKTVSTVLPVLWAPCEDLSPPAPHPSHRPHENLDLYLRTEVVLNIRVWLGLLIASQFTVGLIMREDSEAFAETTFPHVFHASSWDGKSLCPLQPWTCYPQYSRNNINCKQHYLLIPQTKADHWGGLEHSISGHF